MLVQKMQAVLGLYMTQFLEALLLAIITSQQIQKHFFWSFLISLFGQIYMFEIKLGLLSLCFGVESRFVKLQIYTSEGVSSYPLHSYLFDWLSYTLSCGG